MARLGLEAILGLKKVGDTLRIDPCIPQEWSEYEITYRYGESVYRIQVENPEAVSRGVDRVIWDDEELSDERIPLTDEGGEHQVRVVMGGDGD
jgi:cellobiose phosphorylase